MVHFENRALHYSGSHYYPKWCLLQSCYHRIQAEKVSTVFQQIQKITHITALWSSIQPVCQTQTTTVGYRWRSCETERFKRTSSSPPPTPPLQHGGVMTGKIKEENRGKGWRWGDMARQLGSLLPRLSQRDKSWLFIGLSVSPAFLLSEGRPRSPRHEARVQMGF